MTVLNYIEAGVAVGLVSLVLFSWIAIKTEALAKALERIMLHTWELVGFALFAMFVAYNWL